MKSEMKYYKNMNVGTVALTFLQRHLFKCPICRQRAKYHVTLGHHGHQDVEEHPACGYNMCQDRIKKSYAKKHNLSLVVVSLPAFDELGKHNA